MEIVATSTGLACFWANWFPSSEKRKWTQVSTFKLIIAHKLKLKCFPTKSHSIYKWCLRTGPLYNSWSTTQIELNSIFWRFFVLCFVRVFLLTLFLRWVYIMISSFVFYGILVLHKCTSLYLYEFFMLFLWLFLFCLFGCFFYYGFFLVLFYFFLFIFWIPVISNKR